MSNYESAEKEYTLPPYFSHHLYSFFIVWNTALNGNKWLLNLLSGQHFWLGFHWAKPGNTSRRQRSVHLTDLNAFQFFRQMWTCQ